MMRMRVLLGALALGWCACALGGPRSVAAEGVKISSFGYDPEDSTRFLQAALDSGAPKLVLDRQSGPWVTLPLKMRSNTELVIEPGVELLAKRGAYHGLRDFLLDLCKVTNVVVRGGAGATLRMWKKDYQGPDYKHGEWRYALRLSHVENVLIDGLRIMESGGDGIGVSGHDIVIRNCVCDRNHRQGMSVFDVENLLVENCVFSNTDGTAPQAGVDLEPDTNKERLVNVVFRNCRAENNSGNGFEMYLNNLDDTCPPVSIAFENCRTIGNRIGLSVHGGSSRTDHFVKGRVSFTNCRVESSNGRGLYVGATPASAYDVSFTDCVVSNAAPTRGTSDVAFSSATLRQGLPDGITLDNLLIYQPTNRPWFVQERGALGPAPSRISGRVTVVSPDGRREETRLDADWIRRNIPVLNGGADLPPHRDLPDAASLQAVDAQPGELVPLQPMTVVSGAHFVFLMSQPGTATFVARQVNMVKGRPLATKPYTVFARGPQGRRQMLTRIPAVQDASKEFSFKAPHAGLYELVIPTGGTRFFLEKASVPLAIAVSEKDQIVAGFQGKPFSLWFPIDENPFALVASGDSYYRFKMKVTDAAGTVLDAPDLVESLHLTQNAGTAAKGLCRLDFSRAEKCTYDWITLDLYGARGLFFLNPAKSWISR